MFVNKNFDSIKKASDRFAKLKPYGLNLEWNCDAIKIVFDPSKNDFSVIFKSGFFQDGSAYSQFDHSEDYEIDTDKLNAAIRFHVGLFLPKTKHKVIAKIANDIRRKMRYRFDHSKVGFYGDREDFSRYQISISDFVNIIENDDYVKTESEKTKQFIDEFKGK